MKKLLAVLAFAGLGFGLTACSEDSVNPGDFCAAGTELKDGKCVAVEVAQAPFYQASKTATAYVYSHGGYVTRGKITTDATGKVTTVEIDEYFLAKDFNNLTYTVTTGEGEAAVETTVTRTIKFDGKYWQKDTDGEFYQVVLNAEKTDLTWYLSKNAKVSLSKTIYGYEANMQKWVENTPQLMDISVANQLIVEANIVAPTTSYGKLAKMGSSYMAASATNSGSWSDQITKLQTFVKTQLNNKNFFDTLKFTAATGSVANGDRTEIKFGDLASGSTMTDTYQYAQAALTAAAKLINK